MQPVIHVSSSSDTHVKSDVAVHLASTFPRVGGVLKVAQPQVPPSKKSETYYVHFCVCPHIMRLGTEET